jgi:hypothetical protein
MFIYIYIYIYIYIIYIYIYYIYIYIYMRVCAWYISAGQVIISITGGAAAFDLPTTYKDVVMKGP